MSGAPGLESASLTALNARHDRDRPAGALAVARSVTALRAAIVQWRRAGERVALVPTMGALHEGHLALCRSAKALAERAVVTLFVNPKQFDRKADLDIYPRSEASDAALLQKVGVDLLYAPGVPVMYPQGFVTTVSVAGLTDSLCGATRPGHFDGMATVVTKLLLQALPDVAVFGEKDYQQLLVVRRLVADLDIPVAIEGHPTVREADGLALSSRNRKLTPMQRRAAPLLNRELTGLAEALADDKTEAVPLLVAAAARLTAAGFGPIDYLELRAAADLVLLERADRPARLFAAAWLGQVRLIDNLTV